LIESGTRPEYTIDICFGETKIGDVEGDLATETQLKKQLRIHLINKY
jgi:hypothetical protein